MDHLLFTSNVKVKCHPDGKYVNKVFTYSFVTMSKFFIRFISRLKYCWYYRDSNVMICQQNGAKDTPPEGIEPTSAFCGQLYYRYSRKECTYSLYFSVLCQKRNTSGITLVNGKYFICAFTCKVKLKSHPNLKLIDFDSSKAQ